METSQPQKPEHIDVSIEHDLLVVRLRGEYDLATERYVQRDRARLTDEFGYRLILFDTTHGGGLTKEARRELVRWNKEHNEPGVVGIVGAPFAMRTLARMLLVAIRTLTNHSQDFDFFDTETEARAWLDGRRADCRRLARAEER